MKCIILAAGYATRLYPLTENYPKPLLEVGNKPILDWLIEDVGSAVDEFIVVTNHKFSNIFSDWSKKRPEKIRIIDDGTESNETRLGAVKDIQVAVMAHPEDRLAALQKTAVINTDEDGLITSYEEKPKEPKGNLAVPPFYIYRSKDIVRIQEALDDGCNADAPGSFAAWLSRHTDMHAYVMPGHRYDIGDTASYDAVKSVFGSK